MHAPHDTSYLDPYRQALRQHGPGFEATLWASRSAQQLRFDVMIDLAGFEDCIIVDAGCGPGDFAVHLLERKVRFRKYIGIDALPEMIELAKKRALDRCEFHAADLVHDTKTLANYQPDFVTISGMLNTMDDDVARGVVQNAFDHAAHGVIYNFLSNRAHSSRASDDLAPARRFDTVAWLDWAMSQTTRVVFTQAYLDGHDATIMMLREEATQRPKGT